VTPVSSTDPSSITRSCASETCSTAFTGCPPAPAAARRPPAAKRARAYLLTDQVVTETAARCANSRPGLDHESHRAIRAANDLRDSMAGGPAGDIQGPEVSHSAGGRSGSSGPDEELWLALCLAPEEGTDVGELLRLTGMSRPTLYRRLAEQVTMRGRHSVWTRLRRSLLPGARTKHRSVKAPDEQLPTRHNCAYVCIHGHLHLK